MTPEELKAWRIKVCTDLANGVQYQMQMDGRAWMNYSAHAVASELFHVDQRASFRPKPTPRKVWIGWPIPGRDGWKDYCIRPRDMGIGDLPKGYNWQLVEEEVK